MFLLREFLRLEVPDAVGGDVLVILHSSVFTESANVKMHERCEPWIVKPKDFAKAGGDGVPAKPIEDMAVHKESRSDATALCVDGVLDDDIADAKAARFEARRFDVANWHAKLPAVGDLIEVSAPHDSDFGRITAA